MRRSIPITAALLVASLAGAFVLTGHSALWGGGSGAMIAATHLGLTAIAIVGALVGAARWSLPMSLILAGLLAVVAVTHPIGPAWALMLTAAAVSSAGLLWTRLAGTIRLRPPAAGPPRAAVVLTLLLVAFPLVVAAIQPDGVDLADWVSAGTAVTVAGWYAKAGRGALWAVRLGVPALAVAMVWVVPMPQAVIAMGFLVGLGWLAWTADARLAVQPLAAPGRAVPIPAELAPGDILDAAGLDDRGRRKDPS